MIWETIEQVLPRNSIRARFAANAFWSVVGASISQGFALAAAIVAARVLGQAGFGQLAMVQSTVGMFGILGGLGLGLTATKHVAEFRIADAEKAGRILGLSLAVAVISGGLASVALFFASPLLAVTVFRMPDLGPVLRISSLLLFFNTLYGLGTSSLVGFETFKSIAKVSIVIGLLSVLLVSFGALYGGLYGAVCGMAAASAAGGMLCHTVLFKKARDYGVPIVWRDIRHELPVVWRFAIPGCLNSAIVLPVTWLVHTMLVREANGFSQLGLFHAATRFQVPLRLVGSTLGLSLLPMLVSERARGGNPRFERVNILLSWSLGAIPVLVLLAFPGLMAVLFGSQYGGMGSSRVLSLVLLYTVIILYKQGLARVLAAENLMWWGVLSNSVWAVLLLSSFYWLRHSGAVGLAGSFLISYVASTILFVPIYARKGLAPRGTLISREAAVVWVAIALAAMLAFFEARITVRTVGFVLGLAVVCGAFWRLLGGRSGAGVVADGQSIPCLR